MAVVLNARSKAEDVIQGLNLGGKVAIVTGATSGLGEETARVLALAGADVVLAVRKPGLGEAVARRLRARLGPEAGALTVLELDLADLATVRPFVDRFKRGFQRLDLLINNAGIMGGPRGVTKQGFELQVGTNHLGHFALTRALLPLLKEGSAGRVVSLTSIAARGGDGARLLANLAGQDIRYSPMGVYGDSKLADLLLIKGLAKRLPPNVEAFAVHPGVIATPLAKGMGTLGAVFLAVSKVLGPLFLKTVPQGAATTIYAATAPELARQSGAYLADCRVAKPVAAALDDTLVERVWMASEGATASF
jgi:NAD(P)-dependent dehydrogenase (short-subunit alcohol dehydrogenase family)